MAAGFDCQRANRRRGVREAPWSAVEAATAFCLRLEGGWFAAALHGAGRELESERCGG